jgi:hypothetical protein
VYTTIVEIDLDAAVGLGEAAALMEALAPTYLAADGLRAKYFLLDDAGTVTGGVYVWDDATSAARWHDDGWWQRVEHTYGVEPRLRGFRVPVTIEQVTESGATVVNQVSGATNLVVGR